MLGIQRRKTPDPELWKCFCTQKGERSCCSWAKTARNPYILQQRWGFEGHGVIPEGNIPGSSTPTFGIAFGTKTEHTAFNASNWNSSYSQLETRPPAVTPNPACNNSLCTGTCRKHLEHFHGPTFTEFQPGAQKWRIPGKICTEYFSDSEFLLPTSGISVCPSSTCGHLSPFPSSLRSLFLV